MTALHLFHDTYKEFPAAQEVAYAPGAGQNTTLNTNHSWVPYILSHIEEQAIYDKYDFKIAWNAGTNLALTRRPESAANIDVLLCPSSEHADRAQLDYAAINGPDGNTYNTYPERGKVLIIGSWGKGGDYSAGVFPAVPGPDNSNDRIRIKDVTDGTTYSIALGEDAGRIDGNRFWGDGDNAFAHHGVINASRANELFSDHPGGIHMGTADGSVRFLQEFTSKRVVDFLATRAGNEVLNGEF